jgi:hypothetical protein
LIGYQAAKPAIKNELVDTLRNTTQFGAISSGLTALFFAIGLCSCTLTAAIFLESAGGLVDYLDRQDISAALIALIVLGIMIGGVLLYAAFGAVGAAVAGIRIGINQPTEFQFDGVEDI